MVHATDRVRGGEAVREIRGKFPETATHRCGVPIGWLLSASYNMASEVSSHVILSAAENLSWVFPVRLN